MKSEREIRAVFNMALKASEQLEGALLETMQRYNNRCCDAQDLLDSVRAETAARTLMEILGWALEVPDFNKTAERLSLMVEVVQELSDKGECFGK